MASAHEIGFAGCDGGATLGPERNEERAAGLGFGSCSFLRANRADVSSDETERTALPEATVVADSASLQLLPWGKMT